MALVVFEDLPSTNTPINATNLNGNFDAVEDDIEAVQNSVDDLEDEINNPDKTVVANEFITKNLASLINFTQTANQASTYQPIGSVYLEAGTYTLSWTQSATMTSNARNTPGYHIGSTSIFQTQSTNANMEAGRHSWTFTITTAGTYGFRWWINNPSTTVDMTEFMLEAGSEATTYAEYRPIIEVYSYNEVLIGEFDGKPLFRKIIRFTNSSTIGSASQSVDVAIPHGISNIDMIIRKELFNNQLQLFPIAYGGSTVDKWTGLSAYNSTNIILKIINDTWSSRTWYITLDYTKTTATRSIETSGE